MCFFGKVGIIGFVFIPDLKIDVKPDVSLSNTLQFIDLTTRYYSGLFIVKAFHDITIVLSIMIEI